MCLISKHYTIFYKGTEHLTYFGAHSSPGTNTLGIPRYGCIKKQNKNKSKINHPHFHLRQADKEKQIKTKSLFP